MIIVAQRKLIRQPRLGSGLSLGPCASFIAAWSRLARTLAMAAPPSVYFCARSWWWSALIRPTLPVFWAS